MKNYWLVKSEPNTYSWQKFVKEGKAVWDGVRNYQARNFLREMKVGDQVLFYHSNIGQEVVGIAKVIKEAYPDPTTSDPRWSVVELEPVKALSTPVTLSKIKETVTLKQIKLVKQSRLSVMPLEKNEYHDIVRLSSELKLKNQKNNE